jgi:hypothetical protein
MLYYITKGKESTKYTDNSSIIRPDGKKGHGRTGGQSWTRQWLKVYYIKYIMFTYIYYIQCILSVVTINVPSLDTITVGYHCWVSLLSVAINNHYVLSLFV